MTLNPENHIVLACSSHVNPYNVQFSIKGSTARPGIIGYWVYKSTLRSNKLLNLILMKSALALTINGIKCHFPKLPQLISIQNQSKAICSP